MRNFFPVAFRQLVSRQAALLVVVALLAPAAARATPYVVKLTEQGTNVVAVGSGAFDLTSLTGVGNYRGSPPEITPSAGDLDIGPNVDVTAYTGLTGPTSFGAGAWTAGANGTGDVVNVVGGSAEYGQPMLFLPIGYVTGTALTSGATWDNASFASLGVTPGAYVWTWGNGAEQSFTLDIGAPTAVPEPAALGMFGLGMLLIGGFVSLRWREQRRAL